MGALPVPLGRAALLRFSSLGFVGTSLLIGAGTAVYSAKGTSKS